MFHRWLAMGILALGMVAASCDFLIVGDAVPDNVVAPSTVGIVVDDEFSGADRLVTLADGTTFTIRPDADILDGGIAEGRLFIAGRGGPRVADDQTWYVGLVELELGCFNLPANGEVRGDRLATSHGFSLPLSDGWDETETTFVRTPSVGFCLTAGGEVVSAYPGNDRD